MKMAGFVSWKISTKVKESLEKANLVTRESILLSPSSELRRTAGLTEQEIQLVILEAAKRVFTEGYVTALDIASGKSLQSKKTRKIPTGCPILDKFLHGGIPYFGITEIAGESGSGKTQISLQLCLTVQQAAVKDGQEPGVVYIATEDAFPSSRLKQLMETFHRRRSSCNQIDPAFGDNIFVEHIADVDGLKHCLSTRLQHLLIRRKVDLIVIDSIAGVFRAEYEAGDGAARARDIQFVGQQLHTLGHKFNVTVVCLNQVSDVISDDGKPKETTVTPALGLAWANIVTTRLLLSRTGIVVPANNFSATGGPSNVPVKSMEVLFAPHLPPSKCHFVILTSGIVGLDSF